jgi:hypothetical protein
VSEQKIRSHIADKRKEIEERLGNMVESNSPNGWLLTGMLLAYTNVQLLLDGYEPPQDVRCKSCQPTGWRPASGEAVQE